MQLVVVGSLFWRETIWTNVRGVIPAQRSVLVVRHWYGGRFVDLVERRRCNVWKSATGIGLLAAIRLLELHQLVGVVPNCVLEVRQNIVRGKLRISFYLAATLVAFPVRAVGVGAAVPNSSFILA